MSMNATGAAFDESPTVADRVAAYGEWQSRAGEGLRGPGLPEVDMSVQPITLEVLRVGSDGKEQVVDVDRAANVRPPAGSRCLLVPE